MGDENFWENLKYQAKEFFKKNKKAVLIAVASFVAGLIVSAIIF